MKIKQTSLEIKIQKSKNSVPNKNKKKYTKKELKIIKADGVLVDLKKNESRLLFYQIEPSKKVKKDGEKEFYKKNKFMIELRIPTTNFLIIANIIAKKTLTFLSEQNSDLLIENNDVNLQLPMFV